MNRDLTEPPGSRPGPGPASAPLDAEERALAERLAHVGATGGPSPALDARILGAARAALADSATLPRRRPRWPAPLALAASVVFAVGIAWQLREPEPPASIEIAADAATTHPAEHPLPTQSAAADAPSAVQAHEASPPSTPRAQPRPAAAAATTAPDTPTLRQRSDAAARKPIPPPPAPPPPAMPKVIAPTPATAPALARKASPAADRAAQAPLRAESEVASTAAIVAQHAETAREVAETRTTDRMVTAAPAASPALAEAVAEDARLTAAAWLARIADRRNRGELQLARASLQRFIEQHPDAQVPADLQHLLEE